jgi:hypothetical protein
MLHEEPITYRSRLGSRESLGSARPGARIIELSTISPETSRRLDVSALNVAVFGRTSSTEA